jgi:hypothetical protein
LFTNTRSLRGVCAAIVWLAAAPLWGQRVQFPTMLVQDTSVYTPPPAVSAPVSPGMPPAGTFAAPQPLAPGMTSAPLPSTVQTLPPSWDPYSTPVGQPYSPYAPSPFAPTQGGVAEPLTDGLTVPSLPTNWFDTAQAPLRFYQGFTVNSAWLAPMGGAKKLGVTDINLAATFAVPLLFEQAPFLITPGFGFHFWNGPISAAPADADLPPVTYDAYLDVAWKPRILPTVTPWLSADLGVRTGVYTDFHAVDSHSVRIMGRGMAVATVTERFQVLFGVVYLDRVAVKLLPAGGVVWTPNPDTRYAFIFPSPKLAKRCTTVRTTDIWGYLSGEYGGGSWTIRRAAGYDDQFDYNDIRVMLGVESFAHSGLHTFSEVGYIFDRELVYRSGNPSRFVPNDTVMLRAGLTY